MPTYDYHCAACDSTYEARESFSAPLEHECQECGAGTAKRVLTAPRIVFKGSGWYATDSRGTSSALSDSESGSGESPKNAGESKPAETPAAKPSSSETAASAAG